MPQLRGERRIGLRRHPKKVRKNERQKGWLYVTVFGKGEGIYSEKEKIPNEFMDRRCSVFDILLFWNSFSQYAIRCKATTNKQIGAISCFFRREDEDLFQPFYMFCKLCQMVMPLLGAMLASVQRAKKRAQQGGEVKVTKWKFDGTTVNQTESLQRWKDIYRHWFWG